MSVGYAIIAFQTNERKKMPSQTLEIGQTFTTEKSGVVGVIKAIDNHPSGVNRILLDVNGTERWTSVSAK
jgi:hypothetical protein